MQSAKPLPAPVASASAFRPPVLPESRTLENLEETLLRWTSLQRAAVADLDDVYKNYCRFKKENLIFQVVTE